jgi:hypothetical protein
MVILPEAVAILNVATEAFAKICKHLSSLQAVNLWGSFLPRSKLCNCPYTAAFAALHAAQMLHRSILMRVDTSRRDCKILQIDLEGFALSGRGG